MGNNTSKGFTIIETMLFLAITGVLIAGMIVGVGSSIAIQRYRDSVTTFKAFIQTQYSEINNVSNARDNTWRCDTTTATTSQSGTGTAEAKGQSECVLLGRYIEIRGSTQTVAVVTGYDRPASNTGSNDIDILKTDYTLGVSDTEQNISAMEWGTEIAWPRAAGSALSDSQGSNPTGTEILPASPSNPRSIAILIVRSPDSGLVYTFTLDNPQPIVNINDTILKSMLVTGITNSTFPGQRQRTLCIIPTNFNPAVNSLQGSKMAIYIRAYATNQSAIETRSNEYQASLVSSPRVSTQCP